MPIKRVLFVCSQNRLRSPTAEQIFSQREDLDCASAGLSNDAENPLTPELIEWAEIIFVMEEVHRRKLQTKFRQYLGAARVICLGIPDDYEYMDPELVKILRVKVERFLLAS